MHDERCPRCGQPLRSNPDVSLGVRVHDYDRCHAFCDTCDIGITNARDPKDRTYVFRRLADNLAAPESETRYQRVMARALNQWKRTIKARDAKFEKSEDTITWSVFSHLEDRSQLAAAGYALTGVTWNEPVEMLYWGYNDRGSQVLHRQLVQVLKNLPESGQSFSETDMILYAPQTGLAFVEIKYARRNDPHLEPRKAKRFLDKGADYLQPDSDDIQYYELLRNWVIGCLLAKQLDLSFWLVNLVRRGKEVSIERNFGRFLCQDERHRFCRVEWEEMFEALRPVLARPHDKRFWDYIRTRTIHFQPAFDLE